MPGLNLVHAPGGIDDDAFAESLESVHFFDGYSTTEHPLDDGTRLAATGYDEYPVRAVETEAFTVLLEGRLYDVTDVEAELRTVARRLAADDAAFLSEWVQHRDGEFLVLAFDRRSGDLALVTDALGRLPVYHATVGDAVVVSRELKFVREFARRLGAPLRVDRRSVAQLLLFGYPLGSRTVFAGVHQVPPGSCVRVGDDIDVTSLTRLDVEEKRHSDRSREANARALTARFVEACANRADLPGPTVVSLSGGLDSRAVAAGYDEVGTSFTAATFEQPGNATREAHVAERIADALGVDWELCTVSDSPDLRSTLLETKQGMNYLQMAYVLDFFEQLRARHGSLTYVTGDGGDKAFPDLSPPRRFASLDELTRYTVEENSKFSLEQAANLTGVDEATLLDSVRARLRSYPESDLGEKYVHFLVRERGVNWLNHGEDRNRYYFWSTSPFYSLPFFRYALNCPNDQKRRNKLYVAFLSELAPDLVEIPYANFGARLDSSEYRLKQFVYDALTRYPTLKRLAVSLLKRDYAQSYPKVEALIRERLESEHGFDYLSRETVRRVVRGDDSCSRRSLYYLFTVLSLAEEPTPATDRTPSPRLRS